MGREPRDAERRRGATMVHSASTSWGSSGWGLASGAGLGGGGGGLDGAVAPEGLGGMGAGLSYYKVAETVRAQPSPTEDSRARVVL